MVSRERLLLIVAADGRELAGFRDRRPVDAGIRWAFRADLAVGPALLVAHGPGRRNAARAVGAARSRFALSGVISTGFAGGLDPDLAVGDLFVAERIFLLESRVGYAGQLPASISAAVRAGALVTVDAVAQSAAEKRRLRAAGADAVDMEAAEVARQARELDLPFGCIRVISDAAHTDFTFDFNRARRPDGTFSGWRIAQQAGLSPRRWKDLFALKRDSERAADNLAKFLLECPSVHPSK